MEPPHRLGLLLATPPGDPRSETLLRLAAAALARGDRVLLYLLDEGVRNLGLPETAALREGGADLYCCAMGARERGIEPDRRAVFSGLYLLASLIAGCDRFLSSG